MERVTIDYAGDHLDDLIERAARGEDVQIADPRHGTLRSARCRQPRRGEDLGAAGPMEGPDCASA